MSNEKTQSHFLSDGELAALVGELIASGRRVVAPVLARDDDTKADYRVVTRPEEVTLDGPLPRRSLKEFFLPTTEVLLRYRQEKGDVALEPAPPTAKETVVLGASPCDTAALPVVDRVMDWDYHDDPWFARRKATTVIARACPGRDASCFCTAVGLSPSSPRGADILLSPTGEGGYTVLVLTDKGAEFVAAHEKRFAAARDSEGANNRAAAAEAKVKGNLSVTPAAMQAWLADNFDHPMWKRLADRCHGCGACASVCPTCHCFDIVDEPTGVDAGTRRRNWDTCQAAVFTLHGSGHNPRDTQNARFRQRVMHKFAIYPERFGEILCTGCGRCARACPGGMDLPEILAEVNRLACDAKAVGGAA